jgi:hypothetical protein
MATKLIQPKDVIFRPKLTLKAEKPDDKHKREQKEPVSGSEQQEPDPGTGADSTS